MNQGLLLRSAKSVPGPACGPPGLCLGQAALADQVAGQLGRTQLGMCIVWIPLWVPDGGWRASSPPPGSTPPGGAAPPWRPASCLHRAAVPGPAVTRSTTTARAQDLQVWLGHVPDQLVQVVLQSVGVVEQALGGVLSMIHL